MVTDLENYRDLICESFMSSHRAYEPEAFEWPDLDTKTRTWLAALPIWDEAVNTERDTAIIVDAMARAEPDPRLAEAIALQGYEENRHALLVRRLTEVYGIAVEDRPPADPTHPHWAFLISGSGECLDSFFAFGVFELARGLGFIPDELLQLFDTVMAEEARHILFFENWSHYYRSTLPSARRATLRGEIAFAATTNVARRVLAGAQIAGSGGEDSRFLFDSARTFDDMTPTRFLQTCLEANDHRLEGFDPRLRRPDLVPRLVRAVVKVPTAWQRLKGTPGVTTSEDGDS